MRSMQQSPSSVAILLAAYNAEKYLDEQIDSILNQTCDDWTLYIRNDGSCDRTQEIIDSYVSSFPKKIVQIDRGGENLGCNKNFFRLLESVNSGYYMFCDSDDVWMPDRIEKMVCEIKKVEKSQPGIPALVQCDAEIVDEKLNVISPSLWDFYNVTDFQLTDYNSICVRCTTGGASSIFNQLAKEALFPVPENSRLMYDHWLGMRVSKLGIIRPLRLPLSKYRQHEGQVCGLSEKGSFISKISGFVKMIKHLDADANMLKELGYGRKLKFFYYRIKLILVHK